MDKLPAMPPVPASYATTENVYTWPRAGGIKIVMHGDYDALRSVALAYLEALRIAVQHMEDATEYGYDRRVMLDALEYIGKLPERAV